MQISKTKRFLPLLSLAMLLGTAFFTSPSAQAQDDGDTKPEKQRQKGKQAGKAAASLDPWEDENRVRRGAELLQRLYKSAGGLEEWKKLDGVRFDMLETWRVYTNLEEGEVKVHHRTPQFCWFNLDGDGYVLSENVMADGFTPAYRREVSIGANAWAESGTISLRVPEVASAARSHVTQLFFNACMPFSLDLFGGELVFLRKLKGGHVLYGLRLKRAVVLHQSEPISEFLVVIDNTTSKILRMDYELTGLDRLTKDAVTSCRMDFEGTNTVGTVTIPKKYHFSFAKSGNFREYWIEDVVNEKLPEAATIRPWQSGNYYKSELRADYWDPPVEKPADDEEPAPGESGDQ